MNPEKPNINERTDIISTENPRLVTAIERCLARPSLTRRLGDHNGKPVKGKCREDQERLNIRRSLIEGRASDPNGYERIIGESDLTSINFLDRGRRAAAAVCRIKLPMN